MCIFAQMTAYEKVRIDQEMRVFALKSFEKPAFCRNAEQVRYYSTEWRAKIAEYESQYNFVPAWAYALLEEYLSKETMMLEKKTITSL